MASNYLAKGLKRSALTIALGMCFAGGVHAQSSVGSVFGQADANAAVTIESTSTGVTRTITSDASGNFAFSQLAPGRYTVTSGGVSREILVKIGTGSQVDLAGSSGTAVDLETITVVGTSAINPIDVSSVESTTVFTAEQIEQLPVSSNITAVALLAPGTVKGDSGLGNLASFGGASVAENGYYINGFDVTNMRNMLSFASLPFQAIAQQQVKTGGYGAEYGRSLGGVISLLTKSGSNEWHYGGSVEWEPEWGREAGKDVVTRDPDAQNPLYAYRSDDTSASTVYTAYASGPIVKDRLFFFAALEGRKDTNDWFYSQTSETREDTSPQGVVKLDWFMTDDHRLEFTGIHNEKTLKYGTYEYDQSGDTTRYNVGAHESLIENYEVESGGQIGILKYTGYLTDNFTLGAQYGYLSNLIDLRDPANPVGGECPWAYSFGLTTSTLEQYVGCNTAGIATISDLTAAPDEDVRKAYRIDAEWFLGDHHLRFGLDKENYTSSHRGQTYAGGINWAYYEVPADSMASGIYEGQPGRTVNGELVAPGETYARSRYLETSSASYENINSAFYIEDSWSITQNFLGYLGLRWEKFESLNGDGVAWVESDYEIAPRLGFSWDVNGDSSLKVFGNAGRYYIPVATNSSIRATGSEYLEYNWYYVDGWDDATGLPVNQTAQIGATQINGSLAAPNPLSVASANLSPMYQDEYILGAQTQLNDLWTVGTRLVRRDVKSGMDDTCMLQPFVDWAEDEGLTNFDPASVPGCYFVNPGQDVQLNVDTDGDGTVELANVPAAYFQLPDYKRSYTALEFFWERAGERFHTQGSYTYSRSRGNMEGYVNSTLEQDDPGLTQDLDHWLFTHGSDGPLPNDRAHTVKAFGMYELTDEWQLAGNLIVQSGRPVSCQGYIPLELVGPSDVGGFSAYSGSSFYCLNEDGSRELSQRGGEGRTPWSWTFDAAVAYVPSWADGRLKLKLDVFNLFNNDKVTEYNEFKEGGRDTFDPNFMNDLNYQTPRSLRFTVRYDY